MMLATVVIIILHGVSGVEISLNTDKIVSMRDGEHKGEFVTKEVECIINTNDGKFISVVESCDKVRSMIGGKQ